MTFRRPVMTIVLAFSVVATTPLRAFADEVSKRRKIEELFTLIQIEKSMQQVAAQQMVQAQGFIKNMFPEAKITPEQQKDIDAFMKKVVGITQESVSWPRLEPQFLELYSSTYSEQDIDGILAFYKSPTGQTMIAKQPQIISKSQSITQAQMKEIQPRLREAVLQFAQEMAQKYPKGVGTPAAK